MHEETHLHVEVLKHLLDTPDMPGGTYQRLHPYLCHVVDGEAQPGHEPEDEAAEEYAITARSFPTWMFLYVLKACMSAVAPDVSTRALVAAQLTIAAAQGATIVRAEVGDMACHSQGFALRANSGETLHARRLLISAHGYTNTLARPLPPTPASSQAPTPPSASSDTPASTADPLLVSLEHEWEALRHFESACDLLAGSKYAAAKRELELSLSLYPATGFYDYKRLETLGDIKSCLGDDHAARQHYQRALDLALAWRKSWTYTDTHVASCVRHSGTPRSQVCATEHFLPC
jgi:hypothetical protein